MPAQKPFRVVVPEPGPQDVYLRVNAPELHNPEQASVYRSSDYLRLTPYDQAFLRRMYIRVP